MEKRWKKKGYAVVVVEAVVIAAGNEVEVVLEEVVLEVVGNNAALDGDVEREH
jgi:hypothetical protein